MDLGGFLLFWAVGCLCILDRCGLGVLLTIYNGCIELLGGLRRFIWAWLCLIVDYERHIIRWSAESG